MWELTCKLPWISTLGAISCIVIISESLYPIFNLLVSSYINPLLLEGPDPK